MFCFFFGKSHAFLFSRPSIDSEVSQVPHFMGPFRSAFCALLFFPNFHNFTEAYCTYHKVCLSPAYVSVTFSTVTDRCGCGHKSLPERCPPRRRSLPFLLFTLFCSYAQRPLVCFLSLYVCLSDVSCEQRPTRSWSRASAFL